jgi:hypothetical protein
LNSSSIPHYSFFSNTWFLFLQLFLFILFFVWDFFQEKANELYVSFHWKDKFLFTSA